MICHKCNYEWEAIKKNPRCCPKCKRYDYNIKGEPTSPDKGGKASIKKGCGRSVNIGYNKKLDCPINFQCGMSKEYGKIMLCDKCVKKKEGKR